MKNISDVKNVSELQELLSDLMTEFDAGRVDIKEFKRINRQASRMIADANRQMKDARKRGKMPYIPFLESARNTEAADREGLAGSSEARIPGHGENETLANSARKLSKKTGKSDD